MDQANDLEGTYQLSKMLDIYRKAQNVCIWIGESQGAEGDREASESTTVGFVPNIINLAVLERIITGQMVDEVTVQSCSAFSKLLRRP